MMFSPPPSPSKLQIVQGSLEPTIHAMLSHDNKQRTGCRFRWAALVVPLVLVLITASTRFITHPVAFDLFFSPASESWSHALAQTSDWRLHKRHPSQQDNPSSPLPSATFNILTPTVTNPQSIPTAPFTPPVLPTPFPQPYDSQLTLNFSSATCLRFFTNMTQSDAFRKCRPFSLLSQTSATFINAQTNLTLMNTLVWGTCNTNLGINQCNANMGWFSSALETACNEDLKNGISLAGDTLTALNAYQLMYSAACTQNPQSNTYCYIDAVANSSPADLYLYQLPFGIGLPNSTENFSCSTCSQGLLGIYADGLGNKTLANGLDKLKKTYDGAASIVNTACGPNFARIAVTNDAFASQLPFATVVSFTLLVGAWSFVL